MNGESKPRYKVIRYSGAADFSEVLRTDVKTSSTLLERESLRQYFGDYFSEIQLKTIVLEFDYVDRDYLEDYAAYYVRCYEHYERRCCRIHLFKSEFSSDEYDAYLEGSTGTITKEFLNTNYLGFLVVKPLPETFFGRTCITTYPSNGTRFFPVAQKYEATLFGTRLQIAQTLPFQEQDSVVAACATSALWSALQRTSRIFKHGNPSPVDVTRFATERVPAMSRAIPNHGLNPMMMAEAIRRVGLEPFLATTRSGFELKGTLYAYLRGGIPAVLGVDLYDSSKQVAPSPEKTAADDEMIGSHAVTVVGYNMGLAAAVPYGATKFRLKATQIDKIYVHDDQIGPFARMETENHEACVGGKRIPALGTTWKGSTKGNTINAVTEIVLMPLYHKIRIPYQVVLETVLRFDHLIADIKAKAPSPVTSVPDLIWDIYLTTVNDFKTALQKENLISGKKLASVLTSGMPRFLWRATARHGDQTTMDILFDATDIEQGGFVVQIIDYDNAVIPLVTMIAQNFPISQLHPTTRKIMSYLLRVSK